MMELLALFAICALTAIGWVISKLCFRNIVTDENRIYFSPALGIAVCGMVAYATVRIHKPWLIWVFCLALIFCAIHYHAKLRANISSRPEARSLVRFTILTVLCLYGMQIALYGLFSRIYPGPHEVWSLYNLTGVPPPDQMFAWHQAMFASQHRHYPQDPFFLDMDLYDRPHLGGYLTLFFFKLFRLPLTEDHFVYPPNALRFYHCFWWLLNNLYLLGVAPLFKSLFGHRGAIIGVASTALGGFFFLCNAGSWMKFSSAYPFLLAFLLFLEGKGPVLQAALCATSYYIHGSVLPFLAGFGLLQILTTRYAIIGRLVSVRAVAWFAAIGTALVGAWFLNVRWVGSKQPLFYYYIYDTGLTEAQTRPVAEMAKAFYARHTWTSLSLFPVNSLLNSLLPVMLWHSVKSWVWLNPPARLSDLGSLSMASQRFLYSMRPGNSSRSSGNRRMFQDIGAKARGKNRLMPLPGSHSYRCARLPNRLGLQFAYPLPLSRAGFILLGVHPPFGSFPLCLDGTDADRPGRDYLCAVCRYPVSSRQRTSPRPGACRTLHLGRRLLRLHPGHNSRSP